MSAMLQGMISLALVAYSALLLQGTPAAASSIAPPTDAALLLQVRGEGAQVYNCVDQRWMLKGPDAKLLDEHGKVIGTHFAGPTWRLEDGGEVKGKMIASQPASNPSSVPALLLQAVPGSATGRLASVTYIQRSETEGGSAPAAPCTSGEERVPYKATYRFFSSR